MALIKKEWIEDGAIDQTKITLTAKMDDNDTSAPSADIELANKKYVDDQVGAITVPNAFDKKGNWDASTNTPTLDDTDVGADDDLYFCNVAGTVDFGSGNISFDAGDWVYRASGIWAKADNVDPADTDALAEGSVNLYHTDARAKAAAVVNSTAGSETDQASSVAAMKSYVAANAGKTFETEKFALVALDISNGYVDLAQTPAAGSIHAIPVGGLTQDEGTDYTMSTNRLTFAGDLAANLADGSELIVKYAY